MSTDNPQNPKRTLKDRLKTHAPALAVGVAIGAYVAMGLKSRTTHITLFENEPGSVLLGPSVVKQVKEIGEALIELTPGYFVDIIDWGHPAMADLAK